MASHETAGDAGSKTCPECAEDVKAAALRCRFCGYAFDPEKAAALALSAPPAPLSALNAKDAHAPTSPAIEHRIQRSGLALRIALAAGGAVLLFAFFLPLLNRCPTGCSAFDAALGGQPELLLLWTVPIAAALSVVAAWRGSGFALLAAVSGAAALVFEVYLGWQIAAASRPTVPVHIAAYLALADLGSGYWLLFADGASTLALACLLTRSARFARRDLFMEVGAVATSQRRSPFAIGFVGTFGVIGALALVGIATWGLSSANAANERARKEADEKAQEQIRRVLYGWSEADISKYAALRKIPVDKAKCEADELANARISYSDVAAVRYDKATFVLAILNCADSIRPSPTATIR